MYFSKNFLPIFPLAAAVLFGTASVSAETKFFYNQVGYDVDQPISVIVRSDQLSDGAEFSVMSGGSAVKTGKLSAGTNPDNWLNNGKFYVADLSGLAAGKYTLQVSENGQPQKSGEFTVAENALSKNTLRSVLNYFYDDRADDPTVEGWDKSMGIYKSDKKVDVHGGWYDASGDVSKYLSHLSYANYLNPQQIPLTVWSLAFASERIPKMISALRASSEAPLKANTADEAAYGADFLARMLSDEGYFYMTVFDNWGSPMGKREICAFTGSDGVKSTDYQTAFREGGGMAIAGLASAARLKLKGDFTSDKYLEAAEKGYEHLSKKQSIGGSCEYCDDHKENIIDDYTALLAATELYAATEKADYLKDARNRAEHLAKRVSEDGFFWSDEEKKRPFWHASDAGLPLIALIRYAEIEATTNKLSGDLHADWTCTLSLGTNYCEHPYLTTVLDAVKKHYNWLISITNKVENPFGYARQSFKLGNDIKDGFFIPHENESNYWWQGEDARIASLAAAAMYAARALDVTELDSAKKYATDQLDWILGKNPYATCMMYGKGTKNPQKYDGQSNYDATLEGGIANGITGKNRDGSGIAWTDDGVAAVGFDALKETWQVWRWDEQWLPHSTWYLMALVERYDEVSKSVNFPKTSLPKSIATSKIGISLVDNTLSLNLPRVAVGKSVKILDVRGNVQMQKIAQSMNETMNVSALKRGVYLVQVQGLAVKKFILR